MMERQWYDAQAADKGGPGTRVLGHRLRAGTLVELFSLITFGATGSNHDDPVRCPVTHSSFDCQTQFNSETGGNPL